MVTYTPYRNENEEVIGSVEYLRDITSLANARTALEEQLMRSKVIIGKTVNALVSAIESRDPLYCRASEESLTACEASCTGNKT